MRSYLEQHDIPSTLRNEHTSAVVGDLPFVNSYPEIWVADELHEQAMTLLNELQHQADNGAPWVCARCQENNPANFELCWQCSEEK